MNTFSLTISSPDGDFFRGEVIGVSMRGTEGELAILAHHTPFMTAVKPCECKLILADETETIAITEGGLLTVSEEAVTLLSSGMKWKD